jgi:hypothetical protein
MTLIKLTHANFKTTMYIAKELIAGFYYSETHKCTHIVANGGAQFPALESLDEVKRLTGSNEGTKPEGVN